METAGPSNYRSMAGLALVAFAAAMMGFAIHHVLTGGTCSTTGYTRYGPAPVCSSSSTAWGIVLPIGLFTIIAGGALGGLSIFAVLGPLFLAVGLGALTVRPATGASTPPMLFELVFGGAFALPGTALLAVPAWQTVRARRAGRGTGVRASRIALGLAAGAGGLAIAAGVASLFPADRVTGAANAATAPSVPTGASFPAIDAGDQASLYRTLNFARVLAIARFYIHAHGPVRSLRLVPGGVDLSVTVGAQGRRGRDISIDSTGGYLSSGVATLPRPAPTFALSALRPSTPASFVGRLAIAGTRVDHMLARPAPGGGVDWLAYPVSGGPPSRLTIR